MSEPLDFQSESRRIHTQKQEAAKAEAMRIRDAYRKLFKTPNGKIVLNDLKRLYMENRLYNPKEPIEATIGRAACHDLIQMIINQTQPLPDTELLDD